MDAFLLNSRVEVLSQNKSEPVKRAVERFYRDINMTLEQVEEEKGIICLQQHQLKAEQYAIKVKSQTEIVIEAGDDLGFIYALLYLSEQYLGVLPFWFWNDQKIEKSREVKIAIGEYDSKPKPVEYRGWFINDEVLISHWDAGRDPEYPWEMAFEALLRLGGNVVIPGTDKNSKKYSELASSMGLWITHHHAEPLGAEMFLRAYPDKTPSYKLHPNLFCGLWEEGIEKQKNYKVIWNLGFRGQGDTPFWENDPAYDTPEKRGELIGSIIQEQYELVKSNVPNAVCCTNLYGETMELYQQGHIKLPDDIIMVWADNGYGKMVSRRQGNHNPRIKALPDSKLQDKKHGAYYHVSFYDLQAGNVLTMIPNSIGFIKKELTHAYECGIKSMWLVNCSNIKPHVYPLNCIASFWNGDNDTPDAYLDRYLRKYYPAGDYEKMAECFNRYFDAMIPYGEREDEHAGEQFYNYVTRVLIHQWMKDGGTRANEELNWCVPAETFGDQMEWYIQVCEGGYGKLRKLLELGESLKESGSLWVDSLLLQIRIHEYCLEGVLFFGRGYDAYKSADYFKAFYELGKAAEQFDLADAAMKNSGHGKWKGFYDNDCQSDVKETAYLLRLLMGYIRNLGDGPYFYQWQREVFYSEKDRRILLLLNEENHMTDEELYQEMKRKESQ